ncbi:probable G-protein coupled receptor 21 [Daktulosphaira vitifoliae]|uniref:probable G-protein coupled receptor 21 n=1 Tax=Daktulosphaira vitifoliae TaxID=58002 RepID=UPI0021A9CEF9|nr:probable G-protein coupled receptor 21 [Daktulosphaira vitifoliae]XP_050532832.1 probable G-protein coupled receptor 21 [Daktulosphaira vitifoliae]XP_050532833.1 probable G-protein coupled receptor 21 [Daktulosphaira vitifoliae]XP_050532834.1 probable G-protein coupled receptor 21 [Daktulosphaira vitifoliae]XP_050532835.1 probable G-protein coupled receptor 21 [Daktulosphaira vitifoliae]
MNGGQELVTVLVVSGVAALATIVNGYVLLVILLTKRTSSPINVLLIHLSTVDLIVCVAVLISALPEVFTIKQPIAPWLCPVHGFIFTLLHPIAIWTVCGLNCDRYYAIAAPLHYGTLVNSKKIMLGLCGTWLVCLLISMPPIFKIVPYTYQTGLPVCTPDFSKGRATIVYSIFYTTFTLVLPGVIILGCNIKVFTIARYHRHRIASAIFEVTLSAQVTITHQRNPFFLPTNMANKFRRNNAFSAVFQIIGSIAIFYLPYYSVSLYESACVTLNINPRTDSIIKSISFALITGSTLCNGLLYGIKNKLLKKTYQNYRRKMMTKCEINQEIQARTPSTCGSRRPSLTPVAINYKQLPLIRRSSNVSLVEPGQLRRTKTTFSANGLNFDNYYADMAKVDNGSIRRCYSSSTSERVTDDKFNSNIMASQNAFIRKILNDSRKSPRILITRAMSEENESYSSEPDTPVRKDLIQKLSSSSVTLFIDERRKDLSCSYDDDDEEDFSPAFSSLSSSNDDSSCIAQECTNLTGLSS